MNFPEEINGLIKDYLKLSHVLKKDNIVSCCKDISSYYLSFHPENMPNFDDFKTILAMIEKYDKYQSDYEYNCDNQIYRSKCKKKKYQLYDKLERLTFSPVLIDIFCSGLNLPYANSSFSHFESFMLDDIKSILRICPSAILSNWGQLRCRTNIDPLYLACINNEVPLSIIKLLIQNGADINYKISLNGYQINVMDDMDITLNRTRISKIKTLFNESI